MMNVNRQYKLKLEEVKNSKIAIIVARFNEDITENLKNGAIKALEENGIKDYDIIYVPGAFEIPFMGKILAKKNKYDSIITLGCVIRGDTTHYDLVCNECARGVLNLGYDFEIPAIFGLVTVENKEQAIERSSNNNSNKGYECAMSALELLGEISDIHKG